MRKLVLLLVVILLASFILMEGCNVVKNVLPKKCPSSCDDLNSCTTDVCSKETDFKCVYQQITPCKGDGVCESGEPENSTDCPKCEDNNACTTDGYSFDEGKCTFDIIPSCCGNDLCEQGESSTTCANDCPTCDDNNICTIDSFNIGNAKCDHKYILPCCGNLRCELGETYPQCPNDCQPTKEEQSIACGANEICLINIANQYKDAELCKNSATIIGTDKCYLNLSISLNQSSYCNRITNKKILSDCQEGYAVSQLNVELCPRDNPNSCYQSIAIKTNDVEVCKKIIEQFVRTRDDFELMCRALVTSNVLLCKQMENTWVADECYTEFAVRNNDPTLCSGVTIDPGACQIEVEESNQVSG